MRPTNEAISRSIDCEGRTVRPYPSSPFDCHAQARPPIRRRPEIYQEPCHLRRRCALPRSGATVYASTLDLITTASIMYEECVILQTVYRRRRRRGTVAWHRT